MKPNEKRGLFFITVGLGLVILSLQLQVWRLESRILSIPTIIIRNGLDTNAPCSVRDNTNTLVFDTSTKSLFACSGAWDVIHASTTTKTQKGQ